MVEKAIAGMTNLAEMRQIVANPPPTAVERAKLVNRMNFFVVAITIMIMLLLGGVLALRILVDDLNHNVDHLQETAQTAINETRFNRDTGYKNRAVNCTAVLAVGQPLPQVCLEPEVTQYYDPTAKPQVPASAATLEGVRRLCAIEVKLGIPDPSCPGDVPSS